MGGRAAYTARHYPELSVRHVSSGYLNNNYYFVHHDLPKLPWYDLPRAYRMRHDAYVEKCGGFVIRGGYRELLTRRAWTPTYAPVHLFDQGTASLSTGGGVKVPVVDEVLQIRI